MMGWFLLFMLVLCVPPALAAENELKIGLTTAARYNDNIGNDATDKDGSFIFDVGPTFQFKSRAEKFEGEMSYSPRFVTYLSDERGDELTHNLGLDAKYHPTPRLTFGLHDTLGIQEDADRDFDDTLGGTIDRGDKQTLRNTLRGTTRYRLNPRLDLSGDISYSIAEREDKTQSDVSQISGRLQSTYQIGPVHSLGGGGLARLQQVGASDDPGESGTDTLYQGFFAYWSYGLTPLVSLTASGGPTWLVSERDDDPATPFDEDARDTDLSYFANVELVSLFDGGSVSLAYEHSSSDSTFSSDSYLIHVVSARATYTVNQKVILGATAEWNQRDAILRFANSGAASSIKQWRASATASYRLSPELVAHLTVDYLRQEPDNEPETDRYRAVVRFEYNPRAFHF